jgi:Leucine-rich repeat (LRR) protein
MVKINAFFTFCYVKNFLIKFLKLQKIELPILENLFANNNRINFIDPFKIIKMQFLHTLNLQNNDLSQIPHELGKAEQIK